MSAWTVRAFAALAAADITSPAERSRVGRALEKLTRRTCGTCKTRPAKVVRFLDASGRAAVRRSTSCARCQRAAFAGL